MPTLQEIKAAIAVHEAQLARLKTMAASQPGNGLESASIAAQIDNLRRLLDDLHYQRRRNERGQ